LKTNEELTIAIADSSEIKTSSDDETSIVIIRKEKENIQVMFENKEIKIFFV
jgi:hypothetical protein